MLHVQRFIFNPVCVNTYLLSDSQGKGAIIDCGCSTDSEWLELKSYISSHSIEVTHLLNTHLHFDHVLGNRYVIEEYGLFPEAHSKDYPLYHSIYEQLCMFFGEQYASSIDLGFANSLGPSLKEGDEIQIGEERLHVIETPGHSPGSICFYSSSNQMLFSGDTLFQNSVGRTDLPGGDWSTLAKSLNRLSSFPDDTVVYPGHESSTVIGDEKRYNPYLNL